MNMKLKIAFVDPEPSTAFDLLLDYFKAHVSEEFFALIHFYSKCWFSGK